MVYFDALPVHQLVHSPSDSGVDSHPAPRTVACSPKNFTLDYLPGFQEFIPCCPEKTIVIFDWDDTLCPSWFIKEVVEPCDPSASIPGGDPLTQESAFYAALSHHARQAEAVLRLAGSLGRVCIVTLAQRSWLMESAARFMPGFDLAALLEELQIRVFYARDHLHSRNSGARETEGDVVLGVTAKRNAMQKALRRFTRRGAQWTNVLSIGDSAAEHAAITDLLWAHQQDVGATLCKTIKLADEPSAQHLSNQLLLLLRWLPTMVSHSTDFHIAL